MGFPHLARQYRTGGTPFSCPDCWFCKRMQDFLIRGWELIAPGSSGPRRCPERVFSPRAGSMRVCLNIIEIENRNDNKQGGDWSLVKTCSPSFFRFQENERFTTQCQNQNVDGWKPKSKSKARTASNQRVLLLVNATTSEYHIRTAVHSIQPTASTPTQPHRPPVNSQ